MKWEIKIIPIGGNSEHDIAQAQYDLADTGWKIITAFEERGLYYAVIERSK